MALTFKSEALCSLRNIGGTTPERALIYAPGMICPGYESTTTLHDVWRQYGQVVIAEYGKSGKDSSWTTFYPEAAIYALVAMIRQLRDRGVEQFVLIGGSMGGRLLYDVAAACPEQEFDYITVCSPLRGAADIRYPLRALAPGRKLVTHRLAAVANRFDVLRRVTPAPKPENVEPGVDWDELMEYYRLYSSYRLSFYRDEAVYTLARREPTRLPNMRTVIHIGGSDRDDLVAKCAFYQQLTADYGVFGDVGHINYREQPDEWQYIFTSVLNQLPA